MKFITLRNTHPNLYNGMMLIGAFNFLIGMTYFFTDSQTGNPLSPAIYFSVVGLAIMFFSNFINHRYAKIAMGFALFGAVTRGLLLLIIGGTTLQEPLLWIFLGAINFAPISEPIKNPITDKTDDTT